jgi:small subunit ribosomal protein S8
MHDPIADMLTRIRNAQNVGDLQVNMPASKLKLAVLNVLKDEGYIQSYEQNSDGARKNITVFLKYYQGRPVIEKIQKVSRAGLRIYKTCTELSKVNAGMGIAIVTTPKGVMTEKAAKAQKLGGEVLCTVE